MLIRQLPDECDAEINNRRRKCPRRTGAQHLVLPLLHTWPLDYSFLFKYSAMRPIFLLRSVMSLHCLIQMRKWRAGVDTSKAGAPPPTGPPPGFSFISDPATKKQLVKIQHLSWPAGFVPLHEAHQLIGDVSSGLGESGCPQGSRIPQHSNSLSALRPFCDSLYILPFPGSGVSGTLHIFESRGCSEPLLWVRLTQTGEPPRTLEGERKERQ